MKSVWQDTAQLPRFPQLNKDIHTDVLIIGGGIAGILSAYFLHHAGVKYVLVEKNTICSGTTQNTTAKITYQHGLNYHQILKSYGTHAAQQYLTANKRAFERYTDLFRTINCDYEEKDNYVYSIDDRKKLDDEMNALHRIGYEAELCENPNIPIKTMGAVKFPRQAQFHSLKFLAAVAKGLNIYEHTFVREMIGNMAITDQGTINASHVVVPHISRSSTSTAVIFSSYISTAPMFSDSVTHRMSAVCMSMNVAQVYPFGTTAICSCSEEAVIVQVTRAATGMSFAVLLKEFILKRLNNTAGRRRTA